MAESKVIEMQVTDVVEHEDGSATVTFDFPQETLKWLLDYAIVDILTKAAKEHSDKGKDEAVSPAR